MTLRTDRFSAARLRVELLSSLHHMRMLPETVPLYIYGCYVECRLLVLWRYPRAIVHSLARAITSMHTMLCVGPDVSNARHLLPLSLMSHGRRCLVVQDWCAPG
jgi:hypothetical protein